MVPSERDVSMCCPSTALSSDACSTPSLGRGPNGCMHNKHTPLFHGSIQARLECPPAWLSEEEFLAILHVNLDTLLGPRVRSVSTLQGFWDFCLAHAQYTAQ